MEFRPGIFDILPQEYRAVDALSHSGLVRLRRSPAHYKDYVRETTPAMLFGTAAHMGIFENKRFADEYAVAPKGDKRTKAVQAEWEDFEASGKTPISENDYENIMGMVESIHKHDVASELIIDGVAERSVFWETTVIVNDEPMQVACKARPDYLRKIDNERYVIIDLKTTEDARSHAFTRNAYEYGYHLQAAYYKSGCQSALDLPVGEFVFIAVEKKKPYAVMVYVAGHNFMNVGHSECITLISEYGRCIATDNWPAYDNEPMQLEVPAWVKQR